MSDIEALEYNTARPKMLIPEYGRNVQKMVDHAVSLSDRDERNKVAQAIIKVMGELKPELRDAEEYKPKLWTPLFIMSNFELDVDSPYPLPIKEVLDEKPQRVAYPQSPIKIGHYGKNVEKLIEKACEMEDKDERDALIKTIATIMKQFYIVFNSNSIEDEMIGDHLRKLSNDRIILEDLTFLPSTSSIIKLYGLKSNTNNNNVSKKHKSKKRKNNNNNNNRKRH